MVYYVLQIYSEMIGNVTTDARSSGKYYHCKLVHLYGFGIIFFSHIGLILFPKRNDLHKHKQFRQDFLGLATSLISCYRLLIHDRRFIRIYLRIFFLKCH